MQSKFQPLKAFSRENIQRELKLKFQALSRNDRSRHLISRKPLSPLIDIIDPHSPKSRNSANFTRRFEFRLPGRAERPETTRFIHFVGDSDQPSELRRDPDHPSSIFVQNLLKFRRDKPAEEIERALDLCELMLSEDLVLNVLQRHRSDWRPAYIFFEWVCKREGEGSAYSPGSVVYNEVLDILGKLRRFEELIKVLDEMSSRKGLLNEGTYGILINRFVAAHKVEDAIGIFNRRKEFGLDSDVVPFQRLLMWLCRYKHVEAAEALFHSKRHEFGCDIKTWNIILNGWSVLGNVYEAKRFWNEIIASKCRPDMFTYGTFISALTKKGKLGTAINLFRGMQENGLNPDVVIYNCIIYALCFKKRIPEALEVFAEMKERGFLPNSATYNSLIKHFCKIRRMEKVYELLEEMEQKKGSCLPTDRTWNYLLKSLKKPEEVPEVLKRMERSGYQMTCDTYNLMLKLYMDWDDEERVRYTWEEMERNGMGHDRGSYTVMILGFYDKGRIQEALRFCEQMVSKGMVPEPRTKILVNDMKVELKMRAAEQVEISAEEDGSSMTDKGTSTH